MKAQQKTRQIKTGTMTKHGRLTIEEIGNLLGFRHHAAKPANPQGSLSTLAVGGMGVEDQLAIQLEAERRRTVGREYINMIPPR